MIVDCISDLHGYLPVLEGGDLLIVAGDLTANNRELQHIQFQDWMEEQDYKKKVVIAGNHDGFLVKNGPHMYAGCDYLCDSGIEFQGLKIWGSPWTPTFGEWYFMKNRGDQIKAMWDLIPNDTDILVTHGPAFGCLDENDDGEHCGCEMLKLAVEIVKPKLHVFGHIHEQGGKTLLYKHEGPNTICVNASIMNENYRPVNKPVRVIL